MITSMTIGIDRQYSLQGMTPTLPSSNLTAWSDNQTQPTFEADEKHYFPQYRRRNVGLGALGIVLNLLALPFIVKHDDLSPFLKATFCSMVIGDLSAMATTASSGLIPDRLSKREYSAIVYKLTCSIYLCCNINCSVVVAIAIERILVYRRPELFQRLRQSKVKVLLLQLCLLGTGGLLTLPVLLSGDPDPQGVTPLAVVTETGLVIEASIAIIASLFLCVAYSFLAHVLVRGSTASFQIMHESGGGASASLSPDVQVISNTSSSRPSPSSRSTSTTRHTQSNSRQQRRFRRATVLSAMMAVWFFAAYAPFGCYYMWVITSGTDRKAESKTTRLVVISSFPLANSLMDPVLLLWRLSNLLGSRLQQVTANLRAHFSWLCLQARLRLESAWQRLNSRCCRGRNRVGHVDSMPHHHTGDQAVEVNRTVMVSGPRRSTREIHVREAPARKKVRPKMSLKSSSSSSRRMSSISENDETAT